MSALRGIDIVMALWLGGRPDHAGDTYPTLAAAIGVSPSQAHGAVRRLAKARLIDSATREVDVPSLLALLAHGIRFVFPVHPGPVSVGVPTAHSAEPLRQRVRSDDDYVWPHAGGEVRGHAIEPLHGSVPRVALRDPAFHELLALTDALRVGRARERAVAIEELRRRLER